MSHFKKITGDKVYLSPINVDDYEKYTEWVNDLETGINVGFAPQIISKGKEKTSLEQLTADNNNFAIIENKSNALIGNCGFHNIDTLNRRAEIGIFIGDKEYLGKGYGTDALELLIDYGFNIRNLNSVMLSVREFTLERLSKYIHQFFKLS
jgi:RimJ/RimL family protein N-acetyltransferase